MDLPDEMKQLYDPNLGIRVALHHQLAPPRLRVLEFGLLLSRIDCGEKEGMERIKYTGLFPPPKPPVAGMYLVGRNKSSFPGQRFHLGNVVLDQKPLGESYTRDEVLARVQPELTGLLEDAFPRYASLVGTVQKIPYQHIPESTRSR